MTKYAGATYILLPKKVKYLKICNNQPLRTFLQLKHKQNHEKFHQQILVAVPRAFCSSNIFHCHHIIVLDGNGLGNFNTPDIHGIDNVMDIPAHIQKVVEISVFIHNGSANGSLFRLYTDDRL